jgi:hypothetical protein
VPDLPHLAAPHLSRRDRELAECAIAPLVRRWKINDGAQNAPSILPIGAPMMAAQKFCAIDAPSILR